MNDLSITVSSYQRINILVGGVIILVFAYSAIFNTDKGYYPIECVHVNFSGQKCASCGLSYSFSELIRGNAASAHDYNRSAYLLFAFFAIQLFMRSLSGFLLFRIEKSGAENSIFYSQEPLQKKCVAINQTSLNKRVRIITLSDAIISVLLFLFCFRHLMGFL